MHRNRFRSAAISLALVAGSVAVAVIGLAAADRAIGLRYDNAELAAGLIFPPQVEFAVKTYEYRYTARINSIGLRDQPYDARHRPRVLVAAIGDSFTFGQGVDIEDTWVQRAETALRAKGLDVEILNLGQPGSSPLQYAMLAEQALPLLKPDLVLVGMLQSNDLYQLDPSQSPGQMTIRRDPAAREWVRAVFPNLTELAYRTRARNLAERERRLDGTWSLVQTRWQDDFTGLYKNFDAEDEGARLTFASLPARMQEAFRAGELPPIIARLCSVHFRLDIERSMCLPAKDPAMQARIAAAADCLRRIAAVVQPWRGRAMVLTLPYMADNDPYGSKVQYQMFGLAPSPGLRDTRSDDAIRESARRAGMPCHDVTAAFREAAQRERLYWPFDSHLTPRGNAVYAELVVPIIEDAVRTLE